MKKGQGALEYLIIIAAVLAVAAIVVYFLTGALGGQQEQASFAECKNAAAACKNSRLLTPMDPCIQCEEACIDLQGNDIITGTTDFGEGSAVWYCKQGKPEEIYGRVIPVCGNSIVDSGETCDSDSIDCSTLNNYEPGTAPCKADCSGYDTSVCVPKIKQVDQSMTDVKVWGHLGDPNRVLAQSFIPTVSHIDGASLNIMRQSFTTGTPTDITVKLETDDLGKPSGTVLASAVITADQVPASGSVWIDVSWSATLTPGETYWIVLYGSEPDNVNRYAPGVNMWGPTYPDGRELLSTDGGSTWAPPYYGGDLGFKTYYY